MKKLILTITLLYSVLNFAQNRMTDRNNIGWFAGTASFTISERFAMHTEYQWRRVDYGEQWQQGLLRVGVNYKYNNTVLFRAGYAWAETYPYGEIPLNGMGKNFTEHRIFEMVQFNNNVNQLNLSHRLMLEQRWVGRYSTEDLNTEDIYIYTNRLRYMFRLQLPIHKDFYAAAYDEVFLGFGGKIAENIFDQNRLGLLVGYQFNKNFKAEGGYLNQIVQLGREVNGENVFQKNNGFIVSGIFNFDLRKAKAE